jgi:hypothetical protein
MDSADKRRIQLATLLSTHAFDCDDIHDLIDATETITEDSYEEFHEIVSENMRAELSEILEADVLEYDTLQATALGYTAVLEWLDGDPRNLAHILLDQPCSYSAQIAFETLQGCLWLAEHGITTQGLDSQFDQCKPSHDVGANIPQGDVPESRETLHSQL